MINNNPFRSFWMAGFECTDQLNCFGNRVDFINVTGHLKYLEEDYQNLALFNIATIREGIRWSCVERTAYEYDWTDVKKIIDRAVENDIQVVWDICHFGFPDDLTPLHPMFARRFAKLCVEFVKYYRSLGMNDALIITPINEVSFLSWLGGDVCGTVPYTRGYGWEVKYALVKAYIEAVRAIREIDDNVLIMATEPLVNIVPPLGASEEEVVSAATMHEDQFQVIDMILGRSCPELLGDVDLIDVIGCNFYHNNQWEMTSFQQLPWFNENRDPRWMPLSELLHEMYKRYSKPVVLTETSHPGEHRPNWLEFVTKQCMVAIDAGVPLWGVCWYPFIDRPDWDHLSPWHKAGIWDVMPADDGSLPRTLDAVSADAFLKAQSQMKGCLESNLILF